VPLRRRGIAKKSDSPPQRRKDTNGDGLLHFSVSHFSVWSASVTEMTTKAAGKDGRDRGE